MPGNNDDVERAVNMVSRTLVVCYTRCRLAHALCTVCPQCFNGMSAAEAWRACGEPRGKSGVQNIRKRARELRLAQLVALAQPATRANPSTPPAQEVVVLAVAASAPRSRKQPAFRLRPDQVQKSEQAKLAMREEFDKVYAAATTEWRDLVASGRSGKGENSADAVAARHNALLPDGCERQLSGKNLRNRMHEGKAGQPPGRPGPKRDIPDEFVLAVSDYVQVQQLEGAEQKPRQIMAAAIASAKGTQYEEKLSTQSQRAALLRRMRVEKGLSSVSSQAIDDRRWKWLTSSNLTEWFKGYVRALFEWGFIDRVPDDAFEVIVIDSKKAARMLNGDESHQKLSNEGDKSGPRSKVYVNEKLGRAGKRKIEHQKHATILVWVAYGGEVGAPHMMLATDSQAAKKSAGPDVDTSTIRSRPEWHSGIPRVVGKFGLPPGAAPKTFEPSFILNEKGGMSSGGLEQFVEHQIVPAYPTMSRTWSFNDDGEVESGPVFMQLDAGPDRYTECSLEWRAKMWEAGLCLFPGLPNGTSCNQVCDDLFGGYKGGCQDRIDDILSERLLENKKDPTIKVKIDFCDLGRVINGIHGDAVEKRPFMKSFTAAKIIASVAKLGLNPVDLGKALSHKKVRDNSEEGTRAQVVSAVHQSAKKSLEVVAALGFNTTAITVPEHARAPAPASTAIVPANIAGPSDFEIAWNKVKAAGGCAGAHWMAVGAKAFNAPEVVGPALERVAEKMASKIDVETRKVAAFDELRKDAREILEEMDEEEQDYDDLSVADLKILIGYVFRAEQKTGVGKITTNKAACIEYLESLADGFVQHLVDNPPPSAPTSAVAATTPEQPLLQLTGPVVTATLVQEQFKDIEHLVPDGLTILASPPDWLVTELQEPPGSESQLVGQSILYKWPVRIGSWMLGKVIAINGDETEKVGDTICNFKVFYDADGAAAYHCLAVAGYAKGSNSKVDSWVLVG